MPGKPCSERTLTDGSRLIIEAMARAGADAFIGYPITPANLLYLYGSKRMDLMLAAPDEITTLQWMTGLSATGKLPVTATSFPGFALMLESINMAYMMELPMVIVLVQRLGPATGTATCGAQGDLLMLRGTISGGHPLPVLATSDFHDCWDLSAQAVEIAVKMRTPVVLLTSKEEVMTQKSFSLDTLSPLRQVAKDIYDGPEPYKSYNAANLVPDFLPVTQNNHQVRFNASTHDQQGILQHSSTEAMANTQRLEDKVNQLMQQKAFYTLDIQEGSGKLLVAYGITASAAKTAVEKMRADGQKISLLIPKTMIPVPQTYLDLIRDHQQVYIAEENINGQFAQLLFGQQVPEHVKTIGALGRMIDPEEIKKEVLL